MASVAARDGVEVNDNVPSVIAGTTPDVGVTG